MSTIADFIAGVPGIYRGVPEAIYHANLATGSTTLKTILVDSPAHAKMRMDEGMEPSTEMEIGSAAHCRLFTQSEFDRTFVLSGPCQAILQSGERKGQSCGIGGRSFVEGFWFCGKHAKDSEHDKTKVVLAPAEMARVVGITDALKAFPAAMELLETATDHELSILWVDDKTGILCKARLDLYDSVRGLIPDLKTCRSLKWFGKDFLDRAYDVQLAHYIRGAMSVKDMNVDINAPRVIAVENDKPHCVGVGMIDGPLLDEGFDLRDRAMGILKQCRDTGVWPGPSLGIIRAGRYKRFQDNFEGEQ